MAVTIKRKSSIKKSAKKNVQSRKRINKTRKNMKTVRNMRGGGWGRKLKLSKGVKSKVPHELHKYIPESVHTYLENKKKEGNKNKRVLSVSYMDGKYRFYTTNPDIKGPDGLMERKRLGDSINIDTHQAIHNHVDKAKFKKALESTFEKPYSEIIADKYFSNQIRDIANAIIHASLSQHKPLKSEEIREILRVYKPEPVENPYVTQEEVKENLKLVLNPLGQTTSTDPSMPKLVLSSPSPPSPLPLQSSKKLNPPVSIPNPQPKKPTESFKQLESFREFVDVPHTSSAYKNELFKSYTNEQKTQYKTNFIKEIVKFYQSRFNLNLSDAQFIMYKYNSNFKSFVKTASNENTQFGTNIFNIVNQAYSHDQSGYIKKDSDGKLAMFTTSY